mgnify:CR=1 FL=1
MRYCIKKLKIPKDLGPKGREDGDARGITSDMIVCAYAKKSSKVIRSLGIARAL